MYGGSEIFQVTPGSLFYAPKNCMHGMVNDGNDTLLALYACNLKWRVLPTTEKRSRMFRLSLRLTAPI